MSDVPAALIDAHLRDARNLILQRVRDVRYRLDALEGQLEHGRVLNSMGELQQLGPQLDCAVAAFATLQRLQQR